VKVATFSGSSLINNEVLEYSKLINYVKDLSFKYGIISNVGNQNLEAELLSIQPNFISLSTNLNFPIKFEYHSMGSAGKDRIANAVGAFVIKPNSNSLVIDAGTCLTFDFIDSSNCYHGGAISPGLKMRFKALNTFTEKLPLLDIKSADVKLIGSDTKSSIISGVVNGMIAEINHIIERYRQKTPLLSIFFTGGDSEFINSIVEFEKNGIFAVQNLTMIGLNTILNNNEK
tara:strand:+ start:509 stop:1198 length:690 start_codon:yes stop_codon:yes gene_type:complete